MNEPSILELQQVSLSVLHGSEFLLKDISLKVFQGERLVLIGPSGAGKTTFLRLLNRLYEPTAGIIYFQHQRFNQIPVIQLRSSVVLVPQEPKLLGMTVQETLTYPLKLQQRPLGEIQHQLETWISRLHIPSNWLERNELQLSLGQRQLVTIARALMMQPKLLLLDEPTSALDVGTANHLLQVLLELSDELGMTIIMVNHQLELAKRFAQTVLYLQNGRASEKILMSEINWIQLQEQLVEAEKQKVLLEQQWEL